MGVPLDDVLAQAATAAATAQRAGLTGDREFFDAPMRLEAESYESFASRLAGARGGAAAGEGVADELRRLDIDPEIFYRGAQRLPVARYEPDALDPTAEPSEPSGPSVASNVVAGFEPPARSADAAFSDDRVKLIAVHDGEVEDLDHIFTDADHAADALLASGRLKKGGPELVLPGAADAVEDMPYEEISLGASGETVGGRMSNETPRGLEAKLQIDSLTDDEDEDDLGPAPRKQDGEGDEEDVVEAFSMDPDFDYDTVQCSRRI